MKFLDAHTHLSGSETGENAEGIVACVDACDVDIAFVFAPLLNVHSWELTKELREPQQPQSAKQRIKTPRARMNHGYEAGRRG